ncbi:hypothetical protein FHG64_02495 [Antarcticibacterium flavum]|uniref:Uncharacterized protein n=1 Tax=Antarcticibacterium flavum TaxID=2058175 RepID=A0A5B7X0Y3_9FLAO|nr:MULTISPECIES: hypothetical protein [Antarcticibacterium]QCY68352.1 hypothetical protein FHG64_02495 [Antarcticibacterium flavum]
MKKFTLFLIVLLIANTVSAQVGWKPWIPPFGTHKSLNTPEKFEGSPYVEKEFVKGTILDNKGNSQEALLRYNAIEDIVEIKIHNDGETEVRVLPKIKELSYSVNDYTYVLEEFTTHKGEKINGYLIEYYKGDRYGLYGHPVPKATISQLETAHLDVKIEYYIMTEDGILQNVKLKNRDFRKVLPNSSELNNYLSSTQLKTPQDYAALLKWLHNS